MSWLDFPQWLTELKCRIQVAIFLLYFAQLTFVRAASWPYAPKLHLVWPDPWVWHQLGFFVLCLLRERKKMLGNYRQRYQYQIWQECHQKFIVIEQKLLIIHPYSLKDQVVCPNFSENSIWGLCLSVLAESQTFSNLLVILAINNVKEVCILHFYQK